MSQLYLYSNIWIYIWSVFSQVRPYFTYLIHNEASWSRNYLPCETRVCNALLQCGDRGSVKRGIIQTVRFAYQNMAVHPLSSRLSVKLQLVGSRHRVGKHHIGRPSDSGAGWLSWPGAGQRGEDWTAASRSCQLSLSSVSKFGKVVCSSRYSKHKDQRAITILIDEI